jgi:hypothetical protein
MQKILFLFILFSISVSFFRPHAALAQQAHKKHSAKTKAPVKDTIVAKDTVSLAKDTKKSVINPMARTNSHPAAAIDSTHKKATAKAKKKPKKGSKKKPLAQEVVKDTMPAPIDSNAVKDDSLVRVFQQGYEMQKNQRTKDSIALMKDSIAKKKTAAKKTKSKKGAKKKPVVLEVVKDSIPQKDSIVELKDTVKVTFGKNIVNLRTLNGWIKDERGKWVSSPNRIPFSNPEYNNEYYIKYDLGSENIRQLNIVEVNIDSVPYLAVIIEQFKGHYRDRHDSDFHMFVGADFFLVHREDFPLLWNDTMKMKRPYTVNMKAEYSGLVGYKDIKLRPVYMSSEINKDLRNKKYTDTAVKIYLQFGMMPVQNKTGRYMRFNYRLAYARTGQTIPPFDFDNLKHRFYETDLDLFHKFSRPSSLKIIKKPKPVAKPEIKKQPEAPKGDRPVED